MPAAVAACVCGSQRAEPGGRGVSRCRSWRCRRWWSIRWCCSVWWIILTGERAARGGCAGPAAPPLLSHGRSGKGEAAAGALPGGGRPCLAGGPRLSSVQEAHVTQQCPPAPAGTRGLGCPFPVSWSVGCEAMGATTFNWPWSPRASCPSVTLSPRPVS